MTTATTAPQEHKKLSQPKVFYLAVTTALFERFGFYVLTYLLVLFLKFKYAMTDTHAFLLFGIFSGLAYVMPAIGGYLADNIFGIRRSMTVGLFLEMMGLLFLALGIDLLFYVGLAFIILGVGCFKTGPTDLMAHSYKEKDSRIDTGFTFYYMFMNIGGLVAPIAAAVIQRYFGWSAAFFVGAAGPLLSLIALFLLHSMARDVDTTVGKIHLAVSKYLYWALGIVIATIFFTFLLRHTKLANLFFFIATTGLVLYVIYEMIKGTRDEAVRLFACMFLIVVGFIFYIFYFQAYTSMELFIIRSVDTQVFGYTIPPLSLLFLNPAWVLILSPILASLYHYLGKRGKDFAVTTKFSIGLLIISLSFLSMVLGCHFPDAQYKIGLYWIVIAFCLYSLAELLISALGVAMVTHIAPKRMYGVMMGAWFLIGMGLAGSSSGMFASLASVPKSIIDPATILHIYSKAFLEFGLAGLVVTVIVALICPYIKRIAKL